MTDLADLGFRVDTTGIDKASKSLDGLDQKGTKVSGKLTKSFKTMAKVGGAAALALGGAAVKSIQSLDSLGKSAAKLGVGVEQLAKWRHASELSGISAKVFDTSLQRLARRSAEAAQGTGTLAKVYDELGISATKADGSLKSTPELFRQFGDALKDVHDPAERLRLSMAAFDTEGAGLGVMFENGAAGVDKLGESLQNVPTQKMADDAAMAADAMTNLTSATGNLANTILSELSPYIAAAADWLANGLPDAITSAQNALTDAIEATVNFATAISDMVTDSISAVDDFVDDFIKLGEDLVQGLIDGITQKIRDVKDAVTGVADDVLGWFKDVFEIQSPSRVMHEIGENLNIGLADGLTDTADLVLDAAGEIGDGISEEIGEGMADAIIAGDDFGDAMKNLWKRMAADWANAGLSKLFGSLFSGGGFDLSGFAVGGASSSTGAGGAIASGAGSAGGASLFGASSSTGAGSAYYGATSSTGAGGTTAATSNIAAFGAAAGVAAVAIYAMSVAEKRNAEVTAEVTAKMAEAEIVISNSSLTFGKWGEEGVAQLNMATEQSGVLQFAMMELGAELDYAKSGAIHISEGFDQAAIAATAFTDEANAKLQELVEKEMEVTDGQYDYALSVTEAQKKVGEAWGANLAMLDATGQGIDELTGEMVSGVDTMQGAINSLEGVDITSTHTLRQFTYVEGGYGETGYADGGISTGPASGHMELLHGTEAVIPLKNGSIPVEVKGGMDSKELAQILAEIKNQTKLLVRRDAQISMRELAYA